VRILGRHDGAPGRQFHSHYTALLERLGPFDALGRQYASATAGLWVDWRAAEVALAEAQRQRLQGRGRRPSAQRIGRLQRRSGLAWSDYNQALAKLEALAGRRPGRDLASRLAAVAR
jgi:hypothetical protein